MPGPDAPVITVTGRHASDFTDSALIPPPSPLPDDPAEAARLSRLLPTRTKAFDGYGDVYVLGDHLVVRIDDHNCPEFWAEARVRIDHLFDLLTGSVPDVPTTDAEVARKLLLYKDDLLRECLHGLYRCYRGLGDDVLTAWVKVLNRHLSLAESKTQGATPESTSP